MHERQDDKEGIPRNDVSFPNSDSFDLDYFERNGIMSANILSRFHFQMVIRLPKIDM